MSRYTLTEILEATSGRLILRGADAFSGVSIDSRTIKDGELFVALQGERFDGHLFVDEALKKGVGAIVSYPPVVPRGRSIIHVNNTLRALQRIARYRRMSRQVSVIGVTGTNGKTTTKEMITVVLNGRYKVLSSRGNLNNQIGLPLCLTDLDDHDMAVLEMGATKAGDIRELSDIARPDIGVITNIGPAHLEGFGSLETVRDTKYEILDFAKTAVLNIDDPIISERPGQCSRVVTFGLKEGADVRADDIVYEEGGLSFRVHLKEGGSSDIRLRVLGLFNVYNALAAVAVCRILNVPISNISSSLSEFGGVPMRLELKELKGALVISDLYNANPASMEEAVKELVRLRRGRAVAVLGDMLELGSYGEQAHRKLGRWLATLNVDVLIAVGDLMSYTCEEFSAGNGNLKALHARDPREAREILLGMVGKEDTVLIKGSRGMRLEGVLED
ncbi:MAG: UDP-N-acetylmuramoyl-tripeptide--D-alanyl-D-alanine ligase [Nitrospirota bacterium]|nr:UDP-N-acetylmuramoyl-tripeptide--D-alanyl-D-alanine ligase [Nitrospirota bacterium]